MNLDEREHVVSAIADDRIAQELDPRPTFIPLRHTDLRAKLVELLKLDHSQRNSFDRVCKHLQAIFHVEHLAILLELEDLYCHLDPDSELLDLDALDDAHRKKLTDSLIDQVSGLLISAHYKKLTREEIESAIEVGCQWGVKLDVDFELFDRLEIFARGYRTVTAKRRRWQSLYREEIIELPEFQRLIMIFRTKADDFESSESSPQSATDDSQNQQLESRSQSTGTSNQSNTSGRKNSTKKKRKSADNPFDSKLVYLKTFKNIPETDLEILLPGSRVRLTKLDQAKILLPTLSGTFITAYKLFRSMLVLSLAITVGAILGWIFFLAAMIGYIVKSILSYFRTKTKYQFDLTKSLYLKNLDNNLSVIYRILNEAEEQELSEAILAYTLLWKHPTISKSGATHQELDEVAESFLLEVTGLDVDFEVHDALDKLDRLGMARDNGNGRWKALPLPDTIDVLDENWKNLFRAKTGLNV